MIIKQSIDLESLKIFFYFSHAANLTVLKLSDKTLILFLSDLIDNGSKSLLIHQHPPIVINIPSNCK